MGCFFLCKLIGRLTVSVSVNKDSDELYPVAMQYFPLNKTLKSAHLGDVLKF